MGIIYSNNIMTDSVSVPVPVPAHIPTYSTPIINTRNHEKVQEYWWVDDWGFHQYFCDMNVPTMDDTIRDFKPESTQKGRVYSWTDNLGFHQYHAILD